MTWILTAIALYVLIGTWLALKGRLAFMVDAQVAMLDMREGVPLWKKRVFKALLRLGVIFFFPVFLISARK
jgi:uncharacterized membrane protein